jgi:hypothetical protein
MTNTTGTDVNWVTEQWSCPECAVDVGQQHHDFCAMLNTSEATAGRRWLGPPASPGLKARIAVEGDVAVTPCLHCHRTPGGGEIIFQDPHQDVTLHAACILELAGQIPRSGGSVADVEGEFQRRREEIASQ